MITRSTKYKGRRSGGGLAPTQGVRKTEESAKKFAMGGFELRRNTRHKLAQVFIKTDAGEPWLLIEEHKWNDEKKCSEPVEYEFRFIITTERAEEIEVEEIGYDVWEAKSKIEFQYQNELDYIEYVGWTDLE